MGTGCMECYKAGPAIFALCENDADMLGGSHDSPFVVFIWLMKPNVMADLLRRYDEIVGNDYKNMLAVLLVEDIPSIAAAFLVFRHTSGGDFSAVFALLASAAAAVYTMMAVRKMNATR